LSLEARQHLVDSPLTFFQNESQKSDLLGVDVTQTGLIALLEDLVARGFAIEITAVRSDHHDDSALGEHCHARGYCVDLWPLTKPEAGAYVDAGDPYFRQFLQAVAASPWLYQIGLAGSAQSDANRTAAGESVFDDDGADHIHIGAK
jgi:hypothetical protein